jgi:Tfp pilus assembly protein FimT
MARSSQRRSYTLLELVLVCAILVMVSALTFPSLDGMYGQYKMTAAIDTVRAAWSLAKAHALEEQQPYRFAVVPGQGNFRLAPDSGDYWGNGDPPAPDDPDNPPAIVEDALPRGVVFAMDSNNSAPPSDANADTSAQVGQVSSSDWSTTAVFLPDGTARDDVQIVFQVKGTRPMVIQLRAVTGVVSVKPLEEVSQ